MQILYVVCLRCIPSNKDTYITNHNTFYDPIEFRVHFSIKILQQVTFTVEGRVHQVREEPYVFLQRWTEGKQVCATCRMVVSFHSHYGEPPLHQEVAVHRGKGQRAMTGIHLDQGMKPSSFQLLLSEHLHLKVNPKRTIIKLTSHRFVYMTSFPVLIPQILLLVVRVVYLSCK